MTNKEMLSFLSQKGIETNEEVVNKLVSYRDFILNKNESINLTSITDPDEFLEKMTIDSALILPLVDFTNKKIIDVGTGGGFPGTVLSILLNQKIDLLDSTKKKLNVIDEFGDKNFVTICARAEEYARSNREQYDVVVARAVSALNILLEITVPLLKVGGYFIAQKGVGYEKEVNDAKNAFKKLGCHIERIVEDSLPSGEQRFNLIIKKDSKTLLKYPRDYSDIKKKPL